MREVNKRLKFVNYTLDVQINHDGCVTYKVNNGESNELDIEISESVHNYYVNPRNEYLTKLKQGTKNECVWYIIDYITKIIENSPRRTTN